MKSYEYDKYIVEYLNTNITVKDLAKKYNLSYHGLRRQVSIRIRKINKR